MCTHSNLEGVQHIVDLKSAPIYILGLRIKWSPFMFELHTATLSTKGRLSFSARFVVVPLADDIEIIFRRDSWKANGEFSQTDVHRQIAIVFKTPPYQHQNITEEVEVSVSLRRLSDQMESEPVSFTYLPNNSGQSLRSKGRMLRRSGGATC